MSVNLHAFDLLGRFIGKRIGTCADVRERLNAVIAAHFGVDGNHICFDCREDGAEYFTIDGEPRGYVLQIDPDGGWHQTIPFGVPDRSPVHLTHHNDNVDEFAALQSAVADLMAAE